MTQAQKSLLDLVASLPSDAQTEIFDFIEFVVARKGKAAPIASVPRFAWEGALADLGETLSSVALQHKAQEWR